MLERRRAEERVEALECLHHDHFTVEELADVLDMTSSVIHSAVRRGELKAFIVDHRVVDITRADAIEWLNRRAQQ